MKNRETQSNTVSSNKFFMIKNVNADFVAVMKGYFGHGCVHTSFGPMFLIYEAPF